MSEPSSAQTVARASGAGALLRAAREKQGLHIAALAASIKIPQRKLEALESERFDELPDATFARALALTVCRALKIDAAPVLAQLPPLGSKSLSGASGGLNAPFRDRPGRSDPPEFSLARHPLMWAALLVLVAAAVLFLAPAGWWQALMPAATLSDAAPATIPTSAAAASAEAAASAASASGALVGAVAAVEPAASAASAAMVEVVHSAPEVEAGASASAAAAGIALLRASEASWVEVVDASGQVLVQRVLLPGESLGLDGRLPFKLKIGNAAATQLQFRGQGVDLGASTRDNVARLELK